MMQSDKFTKDLLAAYSIKLDKVKGRRDLREKLGEQVAIDEVDHVEDLLEGYFDCCDDNDRE